MERCSRHHDKEGLFGIVTHYVRSGTWRDVVRSDQTFGPFCDECRLEFNAWASTPIRDEKINRILWNDDTDIDEIVMNSVDVHIEQMNDRCWWIALYPDDTERYWMGNFSCDSRGRMKFTEQENAGIEWDEDRTHDSQTT